MVAQKNLAAAMYAIHLILVKARYLAGEGKDQDRLYQILDFAEVLPSVVVREGEDTTREFRDMLIGLGDEFPEFAGLVDNFDKDVSWRACPQVR